MPPNLAPETATWYHAEVHPHCPALRAWLLARFPSLTDVDDLVQEALSRLLKARETGEIRSVRALLFTTARNLALDVVRRQKVVSFEPITDMADSSVLADEATDVVAIVSKQQELEILTQAIQSLPPRCRRIFTLRTAYGMTQKEIADHLGVSLSTVEKDMSRSVRQCATFFKDPDRG
ncbi:RNA polymerase sigma factor [Synoicihabitans lomoniglobus]|uniref:RNA polymerase sigma factor n=1 Tax=Synoicihabitans lomoniglobus TaxID=2909285 RepID=A0AAE9ZZK3_9BACT|nr:RNA polymerase sigma factor [Opitutaceae bacterium LMO-M01]WED64318.1 RNA polymerase sigma factor [Opitutaceae bacterium LMO-M01]